MHIGPSLPGAGAANEYGKMQGELSFGSWLKQRRKALDLSRAELAQRVGCAVSTIGKFEINARRPSRQIAERLADQLQLPLDQRTAFVQLARAVAVSNAQLPAVPAAPPALEASHGRLPVPLTPLIGRAGESAAGCAMLADRAVRLVTLVGPPGVGKTRLALQVAAELRGEFADGVVWVPLAPLHDPQLVAAAIAQALGLTETGGESVLEILRQQLRSKHLLLVLDNCEQVAAAAPLLAELLAAAPTISALATSRVPLHVYGEHQFAVAPLGVPDLEQLPISEQLAEYDAIRLFVARAQAVLPRFVLTPRTADAVAAICVRLDGLPLAIELAAARSKLFDPIALLQRLQQPLDVLTGGPRDRAPRQQTLRNAIAWSYNLLDLELQTLFRLLGVFVGGCTLAAAGALWHRAAPDRPALEDALAALVDHSLVQVGVDSAGESRFGMLETIREYALDQLKLHAEEQARRRQHAELYAQLVEAAAPHFHGLQQRWWLSRLEQEHDNLRAMLRWLVQHGQVVPAGQLSAALAPFWIARGHLSEGRQWLESVLQTGSVLPAPLTARLYGALGSLAASQTDFTAARTYLEQARARYRDVDDRAGVVAALNSLVKIAKNQGEYQRARVLADEALAIGRDHGDSHELAVTLHELSGIALAEGDYTRATALVEEALTWFRAAGDQQAVARIVSTSLAVYALQLGEYRRAESLILPYLQPAQELGDRQLSAWQRVNLGVARWRQGDTNRALELWHESLTIFDELGDKHGQAWVLLRQAPATYDRGDTAAAKELYMAAMRLLRDLDIVVGFAYAFEELANRSVMQGRAQRAARLWGAAAAIRERIEHLMPPAEARLVEQGVAAARLVLGDDVFDLAWSEGRTMTLEQAIAYALEQDPMPSAPPSLRSPAVDGDVASATRPASSDAGPVSLTRREREVLQLVAQGMRTTEVATELGLSPLTVNVHLRAIYRKLGVRSRTAAMRVAIEQHLV